MKDLVIVVAIVHADTNEAVDIDVIDVFGTVG